MPKVTTHSEVSETTRQVDTEQKGLCSGTLVPLSVRVSFPDHGHPLLANVRINGVQGFFLCVFIFFVSFFFVVLNQTTRRVETFSLWLVWSRTPED